MNIPAVLVSRLVLNFMVGYELVKLGRPPLEAIIVCFALALAIQ